MPHDIIDNQSIKLADSIRAMLPRSEAAHFAVGYFFVSGLEAVADVLGNVRKLRLLIGNTTNRETIEQIAEGYRRLDAVQRDLDAMAYPKRTERDERIAATAAAIGESVAAMEQSDAAQELVGALVRLIQEERLEVRVYTKGRLHAKAYIFDYGTHYDAAHNPLPAVEKGVAVVGSSNFTLRGITHNTELNVVVHGNENHAVLKEWFAARWDEAEPFDARLLGELAASWPLAQVTPYDLYLRTVYELVGDRLDGEEEASFLWQSEILEVLADFQYRAVQRARSMIRQYGGCFVADVVGLGKSYIGAAIVKHFERSERARPLIICPVPLESMWERYNEVYELNARIVPMSMLLEGEHGVDLLGDERYRDRDFVLVDESHNFRNPDTQRYRVLQSYLQDRTRRCVLLTATPRNKSAWDIYHQLRLFLPSDITNLPIDPPDLREFFKLIEAGERSLPPLLTNILIRRTRRDILRWYGYDAETQQRVDPADFAPYLRYERRAYVQVGGNAHFFPRRRLHTIEYSIEATYNGLYAQLRDLLGASRLDKQVDHHLLYARYGLWHYVQPAYQKHQPYSELQRAGVNLRGLMRVSLFKRLESSIEAFRRTIGRMAGSTEAFLAALDAGQIAAGERSQRILYESDAMDERDLLDALGALDQRYAIEAFDVARLRADVEHDIAILHEILALIAPIDASQDDKLQTLRRWLDVGVDGRARLSDQKCLIFTQYADTAAYLHAELNPKGLPQIATIYGDDKRKGNIVARFAPRANADQKPAGDEINLLIATDVLSEGLNLQDCSQVINYDLHWNPVRLIQRFGRIDRIGSAHDEIHAYNFLPETELEKQLGLHDKLHRRIQEIHDTIGEDAKILDQSERINDDAFYAIYQGQAGELEEAGEGDFVDLTEAEEMLRQLQEDDPATFQRIAALRDGIRCGRQMAEQGSAIVLCRAENFRQLYQVDAAGVVVTRDIGRILKLLQCEPDTPAMPVAGAHNRLVSGAFDRFAQEVAARWSEQKHTVRLTVTQRYVVEQLRLLYAQSASTDIQRQVTLVERAFTQPLTQAVKKELNLVKQRALTGKELLAVLENIYVRHNLGAQVAGVQFDERPPTPQVVCSESLG
jgi:superfamily II DNA/RNA helicase